MKFSNSRLDSILYFQLGALVFALLSLLSISACGTHENHNHETKAPTTASQVSNPESLVPPKIPAKTREPGPQDPICLTFGITDEILTKAFSTNSDFRNFEASEFGRNLSLTTLALNADELLNAYKTCVVAQK